jgi:hypothetical protein
MSKFNEHFLARCQLFDELINESQLKKSYLNKVLKKLSKNFDIGKGSYKLVKDGVAFYEYYGSQPRFYVIDDKRWGYRIYKSFIKKPPFTDKDLWQDYDFETVEDAIDHIIDVGVLP